MKTAMKAITKASRNKSPGISMSPAAPIIAIIANVADIIPHAMHEHPTGKPYIGLPYIGVSHFRVEQPVYSLKII